MPQNVELSNYVADLLKEMEKAQLNGQLGMFIRNMQVATATFLEDYSLTDAELDVAFQIKEKLRNGQTPTIYEKIIFAEKSEEVFMRNRNKLF